jgi:hypothetical protein
VADRLGLAAHIEPGWQIGALSTVLEDWSVSALEK